MNLLCGASDVALHLNATSLPPAIVSLHDDKVEKMYFTYGIGSVHRWEVFGGAPTTWPTSAHSGLLYLSY